MLFRSHPAFEDGRCASIVIDEKSVGIVGEINSNIIENYKIRIPVIGFELSLSDSILKSI